MRSFLFVPADSERKLAKGPSMRPGRADPRPRGFRRHRPQEDRARHGAGLSAAAPIAPAQALCPRQRARHRPDAGRPRRRHAGPARRHRVSQVRRPGQSRPAGELPRCARSARRHRGRRDQDPDHRHRKRRRGAGADGGAGQACAPDRPFLGRRGSDGRPRRAGQGPLARRTTTTLSGSRAPST